MKPRVLVSVLGCDSTDVGEVRSNYDWLAGLSRHCRLTVLTGQRRGRPPVSELLPDARVVAWEESTLYARWPRFNSALKPGYPSFYLRARRWLKQRLRAGEGFDLAHQLSPLAPRFPSPFAGLGLPLIVGPLAGSLPTPASFQSELENEPWYVGLRRIDELRLRFDPWLRKTLASADVVIGVAPYMQGILSSVPLRRFVVESETGVGALPPPRPGRSDGGELRMLFVGRLVRCKGVRDAVRALAHLEDVPVKLRVLGQGPEREVLERLVGELGVADRVELCGWRPREEVEESYRWADLFLFPSMREPSGNVVYEALGHGLPVITAARGGPGHTVDASCGITLAVTDPEQYPRDLAAAVRRLAESPEERLRLAAGARRRVVALGDWTAKVERMVALYHEVLADSGESGSGRAGRTPLSESSATTSSALEPQP